MHQIILDKPINVENLNSKKNKIIENYDSNIQKELDKINQNEKYKDLNPCEIEKEKLIFQYNQEINRNDKIKEQLSNESKKLVNKCFTKGEYFNYFKNNDETIFHKLFKEYGNFKSLIDAFMGNKLNKYCPPVAIGAIIINDLRKILDETAPKYSKIHRFENKIEEIEREKKSNILGRASFNSRRYQFEKTETEIEIDLVSDRNKLYHEKGLTLGNGISGHIVGIIDLYSRYCNDNISEHIIQATIASSMFLFWSLYYDKTSTSTHSYIEVFEAISNENNLNQNHCKNNVEDPFAEILSLCEEKKFNAIQFLNNYNMRINS